jgi:hypothetical protein
MSDSSFGLPPPPLVTPEKARDTARAYKALAQHMAEFGALGEAGRLERDSQWWLTYSTALAQTQTPSTERPS